MRNNHEFTCKPKGIDVENWFIECYRKHKGHPLKILIGPFIREIIISSFFAVLFFFIKACPCVGAANCYSEYY